MASWFDFRYEPVIELDHEIIFDTPNRIYCNNLLCKFEEIFMDSDDAIVAAEIHEKEDSSLASSS